MSGTIPSLSLEADLEPSLATGFFRNPALSSRRAGRTRSVAVALGWLDTAKGALAAEGLALEAAPGPRAPRRLVLALPAAEAPWRPATPAAVLETLAPDGVPEQAGGAPLLPLAAFAGRRVSVPLTGAVEASLLHGTLRVMAAERPIARLTLTGPAEAVLETMRDLAGVLPLLPPIASLAEEARAFAQHQNLRPRRLGATKLAPDLDVEAALQGVIGHLLEVLLWHAPVAAAGEDTSGVHQMRVALRRLRSALKAFRPAADGPALRRFDQGLKGLAGTLGPARDWDVFLAGLGAELAEALPGERRILALLEAGHRHRDEAYATLRGLLAGPAFRQLVWDGVALDVERPWRADADAEATERREAPLQDLASHMLAKAWRRMTEVGEDIAHLPDAEFHALRLHGKRLRYLAELFAPLFGRKRSRRFLERLAEMQEQFGLANDASVARALVETEAHGPGAWAAGVAEGWVLARSRRARSRAAKAWAALLATEAFWNQG
ncbi:CHAD domain-containing protein [Roseomonas frigidaquae]|uniref:CHAD domain-containing protein n=1 Tax=Falsiroseomonas frigidaquae TaxID=487318 RepID=A0ABX1F6C6_9PROT|nr:CHAD domain-containing protein [Falsiroseomonas frigidaquae]NKE47936.1 CHAD domain-containing protein [Falsiroseomonas frigidaquae]